MDMKEQEVSTRISKTIAAAITEVEKKTSMENYEGRVFSRIVRDFFKKYPPVAIEVTDLFIVISGKAFHADKEDLYQIVSKSFLLTDTIDDWMKTPEKFSGDYRTTE